MFKEVRNLLVVYKSKEELSVNQLKKLVDTKDDNEESVIGTEDGTIKIIAWDEKTWLDNKKAGNNGHLDDKILFIGKIKGVEYLIPTLDIKFDKYGVSYGFSGKQAAIMIDTKPLHKKETYDLFIEELKQICNASTVEQKKSLDLKDKKQVAVRGAAVVIAGIWLGIAGVIGSVSTLVLDAFGNEKLIKKQQLLYAIATLYLNDLDTFMKQ